MNFIEAIETGLPIRRKDKGFSYINDMTYFAMRNPTYILPNTWINPEFFLQQIRITTEDVLATDWEVRIEFEMEEK